jgi:hypothetical protein
MCGQFERNLKSLPLAGINELLSPVAVQQGPGSPEYELSPGSLQALMGLEMGKKQVSPVQQPVFGQEQRPMRQQRPSGPAQARLAWQQEDRDRKEALRAADSAAKKVQKELEKEVRDLRGDPYPPTKQASPIFRSDWMSRLESMSDWKAKVGLRRADEDRQICWDPSIPAAVRMAEPGLGYFSAEEQREFLDTVRTFVQLHEQVADPVASNLRQVNRHGLQLALREAAEGVWSKSGAGDARPDMQEQPSYKSGACVAALLMCVADTLVVRLAGRRLMSSFKVPAQSRLWKTANFAKRLDMRAAVTSVIADRDPRVRITSAKFPSMVANPDAWTQLVEVEEVVQDKNKATLEQQQNKTALLAVVHTARALLWERKPGSVTWGHVIETVHWFAPPGTTRDKMLAVNFHRSTLASFLQVQVGEKMCCTTRQSTPEVMDEMPAFERVAIELGDLFTLTKASNHFLPVDEPVPVDMLLYTCVDQPGIEACVANYRAFQLEMLADDFSADLLSLKMHKPGKGSACDHFVYCLVRVDPVTILYEYDGLNHYGTVPETAKYLAKCTKTRTTVSEMRVLKPTAISQSLGLGMEATLRECTEYRLKWTEFTLPMAIPPMLMRAKVPTCTFDTCLMEAFVLALICSSAPVELPVSLRQEHWSVNQSFHTEDPGNAKQLYLEYVREELMVAMTVARVTQANGLRWPGSKHDEQNGLPLSDVSMLVRSLAGGGYFDQGEFDDQTPSDFLATLLARNMKDGDSIARIMAQEHTEAMDAVLDKKRQRSENKAGAEQKRQSVRQAAGLERRNTFLELAAEALQLAYSGRHDLSDDQWLTQLQQILPEEDCKALMESQIDLGVESSSKIMWVDDLSFEHPGMKNLVVMLGTRLSHINLKNKLVYEALAILERPYDLVPFYKGLGRSMHCVAYESWPPECVKGRESEFGVAPGVTVLLPFMHLVSFRKGMAKKTWDEVQVEFPDVVESRVFTLQILQTRSDKERDPPYSVETPCRGGAVQVLCVEYHPPSATESEATLEFFTERLDEIVGGFYIDPYGLGYLQVGRLLSKFAGHVSCAAAPWTRNISCAPVCGQF